MCLDVLCNRAIVLDDAELLGLLTDICKVISTDCKFSKSQTITFWGVATVQQGMQYLHEANPTIVHAGDRFGPSVNNSSVLNDSNNEILMIAVDQLNLGDVSKADIKAGNMLVGIACKTKTYTF